MPTSDRNHSGGWQSWQPQNLLEEFVPGEQEIIESLPVDLQSDEKIQMEIARLYSQAEQKGMAQGMARGLEEGKKQGYEDGFLHGQQEGAEKGRLEALSEQQAATARFASWCDEFKITLDNLDSVIPARLVQIALMATRSMLGKNVVSDNSVLMEKIQFLLQKDTLFKGKAQLWIHPNDLEMVQDKIGASLASLGWELHTNNDILPGGCRLTSEEGEYDATITTGWQELCQLAREDLIA
ncbi:flagellar assembly protein FliH [Scandinavium sp.]|uniref:flagellar assembly protein FliH n=1 Tax=Scandinavium sp. TaxID=2830653 RepID=UPI0028A1C935|nr:flagellar assembly protein FliH [Scandinavium sp.]